MKEYIIEKLSNKNITQCARLAHLLWNDYSVQEALNDFETEIQTNDESHFLLKIANEYIGFLEISLRYEYVEGTKSSPIGYIEGIYIKNGCRRKKLATELIDFASSYFKEKGCVEMASDCELSNKLSIAFHKAVGFQEANRIVCFKKDISQ